MRCFILISIVMILLSGCGNHNKYDSRLTDADNIINDSPAQSYKLLKKIDKNTIKGSANQAYYALLYTQAMYKNMDIIHSDSLINVALGFYENNEDQEKYTRALIYKGAALDDMGESKEAMEWYKRAEDNAATSDYMNLGQVNMRMAVLYRDSYSNIGEDIAKYKKALNYYLLAGSKQYQLRCMRSIGALYRMRDIDSSYFYLKKSVQLSIEIGDSVALFKCLSLLSRTYYSDSEYIKGKDIAVSVIKDGLKYIDIKDAYKDASIGYSKLGMSDSARYYYNFINDAHNPCDSVSKLYVLVELEKSKGEYKQALEHYILMDKIVDSLIYNKADEELYLIEQRYDKRAAYLEKSKIQREKSIYGLLMIIFALIVLVLIILMVRRCRKMKDIMALVEELQTKSKAVKNELIKKLEEEQNNESSSKKDRESLNALKRVFSNQVDTIKNLIEFSYRNDCSPERFMKEFKKIIKINELPDGVWYDMKYFVDVYYNNVITKVAEKHPILNDSELNFIVLLCCKFTNIEVMLCMGYTNERSVCNKRLIIAKKIGINQSLEKYLQEFIHTN